MRGGDGLSGSSEARQPGISSSEQQQRPYLMQGGGKGLTPKVVLTSTCELSTHIHNEHQTYAPPHRFYEKFTLTLKWEKFINTHSMFRFLPSTSVTGIKVSV